MACVLSQTARTQDSRRLSAPTYYIAAFAQLEYGDTIRVRGASNLPPGASVALDVVATNGDGWTEYSKTICVATSEEGLFNQEMNISTGLPHRSDLFVRATFLTNACKQSAKVLQIVGDRGEFLGNDGDHVAKHAETGLTPGMAKNPQLFQVSGFYFGISALARVD
jgi:hypothetical protein